VATGCLALTALQAVKTWRHHTIARISVRRLYMRRWVRPHARV
jgi:hypothetical protein